MNKGSTSVLKLILTPNNYKDDSLYLKMTILGGSKKFKEGLFLLLLNKLFVG